MNDYPEQFEPWRDGSAEDNDCGVVFKRVQCATVDELRAAISANFAIMEMVNSGSW